MKNANLEQLKPLATQKLNLQAQNQQTSELYQNNMQEINTLFFNLSDKDLLAMNYDCKSELEQATNWIKSDVNKTIKQIESQKYTVLEECNTIIQHYSQQKSL